MTKTEISLLLYLETRAVDHAGRINSQHINDDDLNILFKWKEEGFVESGRICFDDCKNYENMWVRLSPDALKIAYQERCAKADRMWNNKTYTTTEEKRAKKTESVKA